MDWSLCDLNAGILRFVQQMNRARLHFNFGREGGDPSLEEFLTKARIQWHGVELGKPDLSSESHSLALTLQNITLNHVRYIAINSYWSSLEFMLHPVAGESSSGWLRLMDTSLASPLDFVTEKEGIPVSGSKYLVNPRSIIMLHYDNASARKR